MSVSWGFAKVDYKNQITSLPNYLNLLVSKPDTTDLMDICNFEKIKRVNP
jgi:hypothetical protein